MRVIFPCSLHSKIGYEDNIPLFLRSRIGYEDNIPLFPKIKTRLRGQYSSVPTIKDRLRRQLHISLISMMKMKGKKWARRKKANLSCLLSHEERVAKEKAENSAENKREFL